MSSIIKRSFGVAATLALAGTMLVSGAPAQAYAQPGTIGKGNTVYPTSSPYISYARVTQCTSDFGKPNAARRYQGRATLGSTSSVGPLAVFGFDGDSLVEMRRVAVVRGSWACLNKN